MGRTGATIRHDPGREVVTVFLSRQVMTPEVPATALSRHDADREEPAAERSRQDVRREAVMVFLTRQPTARLAPLIMRSRQLSGRWLVTAVRIVHDDDRLAPAVAWIRHDVAVDTPTGAA
jgi:hypothetical protein